MMNTGLDEIWMELRKQLKRLPPCPGHPQFPCIRTLANDVRNHVVEVTEEHVILRSHESKTGRNRKLKRERFEETWDRLIKERTIPFRTGNHGSIVGAIFVQCLPKKVKPVGSGHIALI